MVSQSRLTSVVGLRIVSTLHSEHIAYACWLVTAWKDLVVLRDIEWPIGTLFLSLLAVVKRLVYCLEACSSLVFRFSRSKHVVLAPWSVQNLPSSGLWTLQYDFLVINRRQLLHRRCITHAYEGILSVDKHSVVDRLQLRCLVPERTCPAWHIVVDSWGE